MSDIYKLTKDELSRINNVLIKKTNLFDAAPCFCASQKNFLNCCKQEANFWISDIYVRSLIEFVNSQNWHVSKIPFLLGKNSFEDYYLKSHDSCARPCCKNKKTVNSHVYGKKHVEKYLTGNLCKTHNPYKDSVDFFADTNTGKDITYRIFCESCELLFASIDSPVHDAGEESNAFLHLLRTQAYQYQYIRWDLALAHQFILGIKGVVEIERNKSTGEIKTEFNLDWFLANNTRYQYQSQLRDSLWNIYENNQDRIKIPYLHARKIKCKNVFFSSGVINPSHDLNGSEIVFEKDSAIFYYFVPAGHGFMTATIASFDIEYQDMIKQLSSLNDYAFKKYLNHLLSMCSLPLSIVLPDTFEVTNQMILKINKKKNLIKSTQPKKPSDLKSRKIFAEFLK